MFLPASTLTDGKWWYLLASVLLQGTIIFTIVIIIITKMFPFYSSSYNLFEYFITNVVWLVHLVMVIVSSVRVSNELGRGSSKAAKFSIVIIVLTSLSIGFVLFLNFLFLRERLAYIFTENKEVAKAVADLSPLLAVSILLNSVQPVLSGIFFLSNVTVNIWLLSNLNSTPN